MLVTFWAAPREAPANYTKVWRSLNRRSRPTQAGASGPIGLTSWK